jgi:hypothetical protein
MKPLYLTPSEPAKVLLDGPSLLVQSTGTAPARFPLRLISMIISAGPVDWTQPALVACLQRRVTITFLAPKGSPVGSAIPAGDAASSDHWRLETLLARRDLLLRYRDWAKSQQRRYLLQTLRILRIPCHDLRPDAVKAALDSHLHSLTSPEIAADIVHWFTVARQASLNAALAQQRWCWDVLATRSENFPFASDVARAFFWTIFPDADSLLRSRPQDFSWANPALRKHAVLDAAARLSHRDQRRIQEYLDRFRFWLGGLR